MEERRSYWTWAVSGALHAALLAILVLGFASAPPFEDSTEAIPVETVSIAEMNQIMQGEKTAKPAPPPKAQPEPTPTPPAEPPELRQAEEQPTPAPQPPPKPEEAKPEPPKRAPEPPTRPEPPPPKALAENAPEPPVRPKARPKPDPIAKAVEEDKSEPKPKPTPTRNYDPNAIAKLIQPKAPANANPNASPNATGSATPQGLPNHNAPKMSLSMSSALDAWLTESYLNCWTPPPGMPEGDVYVAQIKVVFNPDGSLSARPVLLNPPGDPAWRAHAESAMRAVRKCDPLHVPEQYAPFFEQWKVETIHFDPRETQG